MSTTMPANSGLCEAEFFLASLNSEESDNDTYEFFNSPSSKEVNTSFVWSDPRKPLEMTPESLQTQNGCAMGTGNGFSRKEFTSSVDTSDSELRTNVPTPLMRMPKMEISKSETNHGLGGILDSNMVSGMFTHGETRPLSAVGAAIDSTTAASSSTTVTASSNDNGTGKVMKPKPKRMSHNVIEKKYRTNINDKILQLREIVPALRVAAKIEEGSTVTEEDCIQLDGLEPARKLNKASILIKTIEYIKHLEGKCSVLVMDNMQLKQSQGIATPESLRQPSHNIPFAQAVPLNSNHSTIVNSETSSETSPSNMVHAYPQSHGGQDFTSKLLLGGIALTMGATCFGENDDFGNARGLFAMPVFHYSPATNGFSFSSSQGSAVNFKSSFLSLIRLTLLMLTVFRIVTSFLSKNENETKTKDVGSNFGSSVKYFDTLSFGTPSRLWETLKKCLIVNRLKYPENSIERIESEIAKCFALKIFAQSRYYCAFFLNYYISSTWQSLVKKVEVTNSIANKKGHYYDIKWGLITNVMNSPIEQTLENQELLYDLQNSGNREYSLKEFVSTVNDSITASNTHSIITVLMERLAEDTDADLDTIIGRIYDEEIKNNSSLRFGRENFIVLNALFDQSQSSIANLVKLLKVYDDISLENINKDQLFVLFSAVIRHELSGGRLSQLSQCIRKFPFPHLNLNECSLMGATGMYIALRYLVQHEDKLQDKELTLLGDLASNLRVWLGSGPGGVFDLEIRGKLINYCMDIALRSDEKVSGSEATLIPQETDSDDSNFSLT
ncbi:HCL290Cp [Eremothecium sinecaudum]|uniref:HCL290Cp n=1 Tax=Eremothecium sinecaudum TaxID=45286 RepID=A0A120K1Z0_9SACH|nr:HCL290Cp [Eremothecium sinecaudum]AMD19861.1 HCL290Cp [Eremothecium sinecaudum]